MPRRKSTSEQDSLAPVYVPPIGGDRKFCEGGQPKIGYVSQCQLKLDQLIYSL